jgi:Cof subfamily protein (haloacid dehalogenase superfamily)
MAIRLLALDLDGTLLNSYGEITARTRSALEQARERDVKVAVVTGRRFRDALPIALELGLDIPVIAHNGALTKHARTLETVALVPLPLDIAREILQIGRRAQTGLLVSIDGDGDGLLVYDRLNGANPALMRYVAWANMLHGEGNSGVLEVESLETYLDRDPIHAAFSGRCAPMAELEQTLHQELGNRVKTFRTSYPALDFTLLDMVHPEVSKGVGVAAAARELGLEREEVMAIGDNYNDLEMLQFAGTGVVMANADPEMIKTPGLHTTVSNDEDGVAVAIENFILSNSQ